MDIDMNIPFTAMTAGGFKSINQMEMTYGFYVGIGKNVSSSDIAKIKLPKDANLKISYSNTVVPK